MHPDYEPIRREWIERLLGRHDLSAAQITAVASEFIQWLATEYDCEMTAELRDAYLKSVINQQCSDSSDIEGDQEPQPPSRKAALN